MNIFDVRQCAYAANCSRSALADFYYPIASRQVSSAVIPALVSISGLVPAMALQLPSGFKEKYGSKYTSSPLLGKANVYGCPPRPFPPVVSPTSLAKPVAVFLALLDVGEFDYYSEQFDAILDYMKESNFDRMWSIRKIASNRDYIAAGLKKCGQPYFFSLLTENCTNVDSANKETVHL